MPHYRLQAAPSRAAGDKAKRPFSLAVMPFRTVGVDDDQNFLAEGLTDELIVELGRFRRLSVASRSASFALSRTDQDPIRVGGALGVRYVLDGQVRKAGDNLRIAVTLTETDAGALVWSDKIVTSAKELWASIDATAAKIAATVVGRVEEASMIAVRRRSPENYEAFECMLRGMELHRLGGVTDDNAREARKWFDKAVEANPQYAAAYAMRVCASSWLPEFDFDAALADVRKAIELDPSDPESNRILGYLEFLSGNDEAARARLLRATQLNPTDAFLKARGASVLTYIGEPEFAISLLDEAERLDPLLPVYCVEERGVALYALNRFQEALSSLEQLPFPTYRSRLYRAASLVALERMAEARKACGEAMAGTPGMNLRRFLDKERFRDSSLLQQLSERLALAGLAP